MMQSALTPATAPTRAPQHKDANAGIVAWARRGEVTP
jgi:hypothetical protein